MTISSPSPPTTPLPCLYCNALYGYATAPGGAGLSVVVVGTAPPGGGGTVPQQLDTPCAPNARLHLPAIPVYLTLYLGEDTPQALSRQQGKNIILKKFTC